MVQNALQLMIDDADHAVIHGDKAPRLLGLIGGNERAEQNFVRGKQAAVSLGRLFNRHVRRAVADARKEGPLLRQRVVDKIAQMPRLHFGLEHVRTVGRFVVVAVINGGKIGVAAAEADEVLKAQPVFGRHIVVLAPAVEVPFADPAGVVAMVAHQAGQKVLMKVDGIMVGDHAVRRGVFSRHERCAEGTA